MKIPSINFNEGGKYFCFAFNFHTILFLVGIALPYPWYGKHLQVERMIKKEDIKTEWHIRWRPLILCLTKKGLSLN